MQRGFLLPSEIGALAGPALTDAGVWPGAADALRRAEQARLDAVGPERLPASVARLESSLYLQSQLLRDIDVMSMAHGLEVRVPFVDHELVAAVWPELGRHRALLAGKPLLHGTLEHALPADVVTQPKQGFTLPFAAWMRGALAPLVPGRTAAGGRRRLDQRCGASADLARVGIGRDPLEPSVGPRRARALRQPGARMTGAAAIMTTEIQPSTGLRPLDLQELWAYRELLYFLVWRDIKVRYKQTVARRGLGDPPAAPDDGGVHDLLRPARARPVRRRAVSAVLVRGAGAVDAISRPRSAARAASVVGEPAR